MTHEILDLKIQPGIFTDSSARGAEGRWKTGSRVRFNKGRPEPIGGWTVESPTAAFQGICRGMIDWKDNTGDPYLGIGTHLKFYTWQADALLDITPIRDSGTLGNDPFTMTNGSTSVTVADTAHGTIEGDFVTFGSASAAHGITIDGEYQVDSVTDSGNFVIIHSSAASSSGTGGGASVSFSYQITIGSPNVAAGLGWGSLTWGSSTWGTARSISAILGATRTWSIDTWGEDLVINAVNGGIYTWDTSAAGAATAISNAPATAKFILVSHQDRHLIAFGAHDGGANNPLNIAWTTAEDFTVWTAAESNTAGSKILNAGSTIVAAIHARDEILIFTDESLHTMRFSGPPFTFSFGDVAGKVGLVGAHAATILNDTVFFMGPKNFYFYDGRAQVLPSDVHDYIFDNIDVSQLDKTVAGTNQLFNEVWWLYADADGTNEVNRYVAFNVLTNEWHIGPLDRTFWRDRSALFERPFAASTDGYIYSHENGADDSDENGALSALNPSIESGDMDIRDGGKMTFVNMLVPDFTGVSGTVKLTLRAKKWPSDSSYVEKGPFTISDSTKKINTRFKGRQVSIKLASDAVGDDWRYGTLRVKMKALGEE